MSQQVQAQHTQSELRDGNASLHKSRQELVYARNQSCIGLARRAGHNCALTWAQLCCTVPVLCGSCAVALCGCAWSVWFRALPDG